MTKSYVDPVAHGIYKGQAEKMTNAARKAHQEGAEAWKYAGELKDELNQRTIEYSAVLGHYVAKEAEVEYLLGLLDEAYGKDNNPAREKVYRDDTKLRIPTGERAGQIPEARDHIFYCAMKERFEDQSKGLKGFFNNWFDVIRVTEIFD